MSVQNQSVTEWINKVSRTLMLLREILNCTTSYLILINRQIMNQIERQWANSLPGNLAQPYVWYYSTGEKNV